MCQHKTAKTSRHQWISVQIRQVAHLQNCPAWQSRHTVPSSPPSATSRTTTPGGHWAGRATGRAWACSPIPATHSRDSLTPTYLCVVWKPSPFPFLFLSISLSFSTCTQEDTRKELQEQGSCTVVQTRSNPTERPAEELAPGAEFSCHQHSRWHEALGQLLLGAGWAESITASSPAPLECPQPMGEQLLPLSNTELLHTPEARSPPEKQPQSGSEEKPPGLHSSKAKAHKAQRTRCRRMTRNAGDNV